MVLSLSLRLVFHGNMHRQSKAARASLCAECPYAECLYVECTCAEYPNANCLYAECPYADCHYAVCPSADSSNCSLRVNSFKIGLYWSQPFGVLDER